MHHHRKKHMASWHALNETIGVIGRSGIDAVFPRCFRTTDIQGRLEASVALSYSPRMFLHTT